jgi:hypothetical protein
MTLSVLGGHLASFLSLGLLVPSGGLFLDEANLIAASLAPVFSGCSAAIVTYWLKIRRLPRRNLPGVFPILVATTSAAIAVGVPTLLWLRSYNVIRPDEMLFLLAGFESASALMLGGTVPLLFATRDPQ